VADDKKPSGAAPHGPRRIIFVTYMNDSKISWTHHTVNFWMGCTKVSAGCRECYAEGECARFDHAEWGDDADRTPVKSAHPNARKFDRAAREKECQDVVFCASLSDIFEDRADVEELREAAWKTIRETPNLVWILLTKRPENIAPMLPADWGEEGYPNVCLAATVENSDPKVLERIDILRRVPARWRMLSVEPLIGPLDLQGQLDGIHMVVCGGESGKKGDPNVIRPMHPDWARAVRDACLDAEVPFFFKQWGSWCTTKPAPTIRENPAQVEWQGLTLYFGGKAKPGEVHLPQLDGKQWHQHPFGPDVDLGRPSAHARRLEQKQNSPELPKEDQQDFERFDKQIRKGAQTFREMGFYLKEVKQRRLWRAGSYPTWASYCDSIVGFSKAHANRLIKAAESYKGIVEAAPIGADGEKIVPVAESQMRPLTKIKDPAMRAEAWSKAVERSEEVPTAETVRVVVDEIMAAPDDPAPPSKVCENKRATNPTGDKAVKRKDGVPATQNTTDGDATVLDAEEPPAQVANEKELRLNAHRKVREAVEQEEPYGEILILLDELELLL
jgi:protein gp37